MNRYLESLTDYLAANQGVETTGYQHSFVKKQLMARIKKTGKDTPEQYLKYLKCHPDEIDILKNILSVNVSSFFRNSRTFECIAKEILPMVFSRFEKGHNNALRIWCAGCANGEEAYSIAILINEILEQDPKPLDLNIFATDIDPNALKKAKEAVYPYESIQNTKYRIVKKHFKKHPGSFALNARIKQMVQFSFYDILDPKTYVPAESVFGNFDMVLCRNLLIYFNGECQNMIFEKLYRSLSSDGFLVLGEAEAPLQRFSNRFKKMGDHYHVYQRAY